ncbi:3-phosphoshikimate 1-carboxyvinyltransferase [hydrothermal vent metagenome]|uniref:3-phosphoshikimate 1-carboxyvinyltransferase n=1 Tax=hydrothermal vent metagenome TaxID=652676 RepID=A0A3B0YAX9_9ZZZZ
MNDGNPPSNNLQFIVQGGGTLVGEIKVPGDKSISHRSIMLGSLADGDVEVTGFLEGDDALATLDAFRAMGVDIEGPTNGRVIIHGVGMQGLKGANRELDLGNSGTSMRLLTGLLSGQNFDSILTGDSSLSSRPMRRVINPSISLGAKINSCEDGTAPLNIVGNQPLKGISYAMPVASAQVKSCVLLAGLYAQGRTCVTEPAPTRDHTERMLQGLGYEVNVEGATVCIEGGGKLKAVDIEVPADISSAAFFLVGASIAKGSELTLRQTGVNPTRTGVIDILKLMGADIEVLSETLVCGEPVADIKVRAASLKGIEIPGALVPLAIDEFPAIFIAAACAEGTTILSGAEELRVKESDRIQVMADGLEILGIKVVVKSDGIIIEGGQLTGGEVNSHGDHRIAMSFAMAGLMSTSVIRVNDCLNVNTSFPGFVAMAKDCGLFISTSSDHSS